MTYRHTTIRSESPHVVVHEIHDRLDRTLQLLNFQGKPHMILDTYHCQSGTYLTPSMAGELAHTFDHYSRHHTLPTGNSPDPEPLAFI